ncbi:DUF2065 domain-containing protein [Thiomicrorhabdus indica]|uniref:DUF2065 domain-containing protein n=1 Tax=Thiomicrorhabdus indica TaxID=2267253 RepID=UPI00102D95D6|nr:DUF2065 domain-containing protein [Thiomicrorhabdus indica]
MTEVLIAAIALLFIFEGLLPFVAPSLWQKVMREASEMPENSLRIMGFASIVIGLVLLLFFSESN